MIGIEGYFPLVNAVRCNIDIPKWDENQYILPNIDLLSVEKVAVYDLTYKIPQTRKYFRKVIVKYDEKKGIIQIGRSIGKNERGVRVNENILCGYDNKMVLRTIYIIPDEFV